MDKYGSVCNSLPEVFLTALTKQKKTFLPEVFENFEQWALELGRIGYDKNSESIQKFLAEGVGENLYEPTEKTIGIFKDLVIKDEELACTSIVTVLGSLIDQEKTNGQKFQCIT